MDKLTLMKRISKSEWFVLTSPLGEPGIEWRENEEYKIERMVEIDGNIIWFGREVIWRKKNKGAWEKTIIGGGFAPSEIPIYEQLYQELFNVNVK